MEEMDTINKSFVVDDEDDYNSIMKPLNESVLQWIELGRNIILKDVPYDIHRVIIRHVYPQSDWKQFACALGITNIQVLNEIEGDAIAQKRWESDVLLEYCVQQTQMTFGELLKILYFQLKRYFILQELYNTGAVKNFLNSYNETKKPEPKLHKSLQGKSSGLFQENDKFKAILSKIEGKQDDLLSEDFNNYLLTNKRMLKQAQEINCYQLSTSTARENVQVPDIQYLDEFEKQIQSKHYEKIIPRPFSNKKKVVVLLSYSKDAEDIVPLLVKKFWNIQVGVISEYVLKDKGYFETDFITSWQKFFQQSQFIVPIVSKDYLKDIQQPTDEKLSRGVRFVYDMYTRRYVNDGCLNHFVRPLVIDNVSSKMLVGINPTLEMRWKIWDDFEEYLKMINQHYVL